MDPQKISHPQMLEMIERYFDCTLTEEEEKRLRVCVAASTHPHPSIDEAKAVMGFLKPKREVVSSPAKSPLRWRSIAAVAAAAAMLTIGAFFFLYRPINAIEENTCIAYVN